MNKLISITVFVLMGAVLTVSTATQAYSINEIEKTGHKISHQAKAVVSDTKISSKIRYKFAKNNVVSVFDIKVDVNHGVVTLVGALDTSQEYEQAVMLAQSVQGVKDVITTRLTVKDSSQPISDTLITAKVRGQLLKHQALGDIDQNTFKLAIETQEGKVQLMGIAQDDTTRTAIIKIAEAVSGVKSVDADGLRTR